MVKKKSEEKNYCEDCGAPIRDEEVFRHEDSKYCPVCAAEHIRDEHLNSAEAKRLFTYKST
jgi:predicted nucleic acid-binding Zn ribbon protein